VKRRSTNRSVLATSEIVVSVSRRSRAALLIFSESSLGALPSFRPQALAATTTAWVRSLIVHVRTRRERRRWKISRPSGIVVSIASMRIGSETPSASSLRAVLIKCGSERPRRSNVQTTSVSPRLAWLRARARTGRLVAAPEARSENVRSRLTTLRASSCIGAVCSSAEIRAYRRNMSRKLAGARFRNNEFPTAFATPKRRQRLTFGVVDALNLLCMPGDGSGTFKINA
jgi:hypothetical protein